MIKRLHLNEKFKQLCFILIFSVVVFFQTDFNNLKALPMDNYKSEIIVEELRLKVPTQFKEVWLEAERKVWDPWLAVQNGYMGRR